MNYPRVVFPGNIVEQVLGANRCFGYVLDDALVSLLENQSDSDEVTPHVAAAVQVFRSVVDRGELVGITGKDLTFFSDALRLTAQAANTYYDEVKHLIPDRYFTVSEDGSTVIDLMEVTSEDWFFDLGLMGAVNFIIWKES